MTAVAVRLGSEVDIEISAKEDGTLQSFETYYLANIGPLHRPRPHHCRRLKPQGGLPHPQLPL